MAEYRDTQIRAALEGSEIAGGDAYTEADGKLHPADADVEVGSVEALLDALDSSAEIVAIANQAELDLSKHDMVDLGDKTLVSYRGWGGAEGALIHTSRRGTQSRSRRPATTFYSYGSPRVTGIRLRGPRHSSSLEFTRWDYGDNLARGIMLRGPSAEVDNCELWGWPWNAVHVKGNGKRTVTEAEIHHNHAYRSLQIGYGYAFDVWRGWAHFHHNYTNETRHCYNLFGWPNSGYVLEDSVIGPEHYSHSVDAHCLTENGNGVGDKPNHPEYDLRAGERVEVRRNTFCYNHTTGITFRGVPLDRYVIEDNRFAHGAAPKRNSGNSGGHAAWRQANLELSSWDPLPLDSAGFYRLEASGNQFGAPSAPRIRGVGAPVDLLGRGDLTRRSLITLGLDDPHGRQRGEACREAEECLGRIQAADAN